MDSRLKLIEQWLQNSVGLGDFTLKPASSDASFRRYFRVDTGSKTFIVMDAPPQKEDCRPFIAVARVLLRFGLQVPHILAEDLKQGFLLLSDFGSRQFLAELNDGNVDSLYLNAMGSLQRLQQIPHDVLPLPLYSSELLQQEMRLFYDWFLVRHLKMELSDEKWVALFDCFDILATSALEQPRVWVHRDYHSRNLMVLETTDEPGILDFQDAVIGPVTYDLVSLLRDCYISWPREQVEEWLGYYHSSCKSGSKEQFLRWFDLMGVQRHLKAIGIFARLDIRDGKSGYLGDIPRTLGYIEDVCGRYDELKGLRQILDLIPH